MTMSTQSPSLNAAGFIVADRLPGDDNDDNWLLHRAEAKRPKRSPGAIGAKSGEIGYGILDPSDGRAYDALNRELSITMPGGGVWQTNYDKAWACGQQD